MAVRCRPGRFGVWLGRPRSTPRYTFGMLGLHRYLRDVLLPILPLDHHASVVVGIRDGIHTITVADEAYPLLLGAGGNNITAIEVLARAFVLHAGKAATTIRVRALRGAPIGVRVGAPQPGATFDDLVGYGRTLVEPLGGSVHGITVHAPDDRVQLNVELPRASLAIGAHGTPLKAARTLARAWCGARTPRIGPLGVAVPIRTV